MLDIAKFPRGVDPDIDKAIPATVGWIGPERVAASPNFAYQPGKLILGSVGEKLIGYMDDRHMLTVAGSRSGKSVGVISNLLDYPGSVIAIDPKGELARITRRFRHERLKQNTIVLDPFSTSGWKTASFNPMAMLDPSLEDSVDDAGLLADALIIPDGRGQDHWTLSAKNLLHGLILHVATTRPPALRNLLHVRELLASDQRDLEELFIEMSGNDVFGGAVAQVGDSMSAKPENERGSIISTAIEQTSFLVSPAMERVLADSAFTLADIKKKPTTLYLCLPAGRMATHFRWLRIILNMALIAMERERTKPRLPVLFVLDEFPILGHMRSIESAAGQMASFDVKLWPIIQDISQLRAHYKASWETFIGNAGVTQWFGNTDHSTAEYVSKLLGKLAIRVVNEGEVTRSGQGAGLQGQSRSTMLHELMTPEEVTRYFARETGLQIIKVPGFKPMAVGRVVYHTHPHFKGRYEP